LKFKELASRNLKEVYRDKVALGFLMGMPLAFILIFGWAFASPKALARRWRKELLSHLRCFTMRMTPWQHRGLFLWSGRWPFRFWV